MLRYDSKIYPSLDVTHGKKSFLSSSRFTEYTAEEDQIEVPKLLASSQGGSSELSTITNDCPKTLLDELDQVERHLNLSTLLSDWHGISVSEPARKEGEVIWHAQRCPQEKMVINCPGKRVKAPLRAYEKAFYPKNNTSPKSLHWLER